MPQPRIIDDEGRAEITRIAELRASIPSDKELARRYGCSVNTIKYWIQEARAKSLKRLVSCETNVAHHAHSGAQEG